MVHRIDQTSTFPLEPIQVSPRSFKRQIETVIGALSQLTIPVTLFAKLPKGTSWLVDLQQYSQAIHPQPEIFLWVRETTDVPNWQTSVLLPDESERASCKERV